MWVVAGVLVGLVLATLLVGFHTGPHAHAVAVGFGALLAGWLILMAAMGMSAPVLWALLSADVAVSGGAGALAWHGLGSARHTPSMTRSLVGTEGVAVSDLAPEGIAKVGGEQWSVVSLNGKVRAGTRVQVLRAEGVRLEVWGEDPDVLPTDLSAELQPSTGEPPSSQQEHQEQES
ncbi:MAG: NfeD family protein [Acidimicrobiaceae bacterium]|nr:NfeD family protein [Acidimicrobiaceae bacterium]